MNVDFLFLFHFTALLQHPGFYFDENGIKLYDKDRLKIISNDWNRVAGP